MIERMAVWDDIAGEARDVERGDVHLPRGCLGIADHLDRLVDLVRVGSARVSRPSMR